MRNRAKCKLCDDIIESFHRHDYVSCKCGEISIDGGTDCWRAAARAWINFIRIDDEDREVPIKVFENGKELFENKDDLAKNDQEHSEPAKILDEMIQSYENLPQHAMLQPATNADVLSMLLLFQRLFSLLEQPHTMHRS